MKTKLTSSASLGKTLARNQKVQLSLFSQPKEFDTRSVNQSRQQSKKRKRSIGQTPKQSAQKHIPAKLSVQESMIKINLNRKKCIHIGEDVHTATVDKHFKLNKMYKDLHHFLVCIDELKWILSQGDKLIQKYLSQIVLISPQSSHTLDISNISQEFRSLVLRFAHIEQNKLQGIDQYFKNNKFEWQKNVQMHNEQQSNPQRNHLKAFIERSLNVSNQQKEQKELISSIAQTKHFSVPLKENTNSSNLPYFDNIKIISQEPQTPKLKQDKNFNKPLQISSKLNKENVENLSKQKERLQNKWKRQNEKNQQLRGANERLKEQINSFQVKLSKYTVLTTKTIQKLSQILKRMVGKLTSQQRELQLLKMAQSLNSWEKMLQNDVHEAKYREIYGNPETLDIQKTKKLQQIVGLQYEINNMLAERTHLQKIGKINQVKLNESKLLDEDLYRMLIVQSCILEQLCNF